ncbi:MAG TPA: hypothetical protein VK980_10305 [Sphingomonas sp.]|nr:hypothetical protein [Sphingomonas sp.]
MRPVTIVTFERLMFAMLALGLVHAWSNFHKVTALPRGFVLTLIALTFALVIVLTLLVSLRRSKVAMWILIVLFVLGLPALVTTLRLAWVGAVTALAAGSDGLQSLLQLVAYGLLFTPSARRWLNNETTLDDLGETFA